VPLRVPQPRAVGVDYGVQVAVRWPTLPSFRTLAELTPFAVQFRYDTSALSQGELNRSDLVLRITSLIDHIESLLDRG
jgi:hypothetical protein